MTIVRVAIPLLKGKRRFHIDKGRPWSVVEHAMLAAVAEQPQQVSDLAAAANLPRRLVLDILIRLMRAGWVVVDQRSDGVVFSASQSGQSVVDLDELPIARVRIRPILNFVIDKITGTLYRSRELPFYDRHVVEERAARERIVWLEPRSLDNSGDPAALVSTLLADDEKFVSLDPAGDRLVDRYALVSVSNGTVDGLPKRAPSELSRLVLEAAKQAPPSPAGNDSPTIPAPPPISYEDRDLPRAMEVVFSHDDIITGGPAHESTLHEAIRHARHRLVIHSTFITEEKYGIVRPLLYDAVRRGALIDILWGEDAEKSGSKASKAAVRRLREEIDIAGLGASLRIHSFSTRSHAKLLFADDGSPNRYFAVVGSCNWLSSGFHSFEVSVRLRDPRLVAAVVDQLTAMTLGDDGHWTDLTSEFAEIYSDLLRRPTPSGTRAAAALVLGPQHGQYIHKARDSARSSIFVTSHRLGAANRPAVIVPAIAAAEASGIEATVYFGIPTGTYTKGDAADLSSSAEARGVKIQAVQEPRLHAKVLAWDDDYLLVTSQNWLSADPNETNIRREIGVYIEAKDAGRHVIEIFESLRGSNSASR